jgi:hypothetical protein
VVAFHHIRIFTLSEENMDKALHDRIAKVAYELYEKKGRRNGCQEEDWLEAEKIVRAELTAEIATKRLREGKPESKKAAVKAEPKKAGAKKAAAVEAGKKGARQQAKTAASKKKISPEATI